jgi:hypothetical protein
VIVALVSNDDKQVIKHLFRHKNEMISQISFHASHLPLGSGISVFGFDRAIRKKTSVRVSAFVKLQIVEYAQDAGKFTAFFLV